MSLLKTNEIQNYNGSSLTLTASTVSTSAQLNTGGNISVTGSLNVSDDSTTRTNLGLGTIATQDSDNVDLTGGTIGSGVTFSALGNSAVGTVSESSGTPTGDIIERGSNANGEYVKYADGTLICTREDSHDATSTSNATFDYPSSYNANPAVAMGHSNGSASSTADSVNTVVQRTATQWRVRTSSAGSNTITITLIAIGRWY